MDRPSLSANSPQIHRQATEHPFPHLRWLAVVWLCVYLPSYTAAYGVANFLFLCNLGVILTAAGVIARSSLLLSSQTIAALTKEHDYGPRSPEALAAANRGPRWSGRPARPRRA